MISPLTSLPGSSALRERIARLRQVCAGLADTLERDAESLSTTGRPPAESLLADVAQFRRQVAELLGAVPSPKALSTLDDVAAAVDARDRDAESLPILARFLELSANDGPARDLLTAAQRQATVLREDILQGRAPADLIDGLRRGDHPWTALLSLVDAQADIDDEQWTLLTDRVGDGLGRAVATAAARGRISSTPLARDVPMVAMSGGTAPMEPVSYVTPERAVPLPPESISPGLAGEVRIELLPQSEEARGFEESDETVIPSVWSESVFEDLFHSPPAIAVDLDPMPLGSPSSCEMASAEPRTDETDSADPHSVRGLATSALRCEGSERLAVVARLIGELTRTGRIGLAYHLSRSLEALDVPQTGHLPSALIRALGLGQEVNVAEGESAGLLKRDFKQLKRVAEGLGSDDHSFAVELLIQAAALRPALIVPAAGAASLLRALRLTAQNTPLNDFCTQVGTYGETIHRSTSLNSDVDSQEDRRSGLREEVRAWRNDVLYPNLELTSATPLFLKAHWSLRSATATCTKEDRLTWTRRLYAARIIDAVIDPILNEERIDVARLKSDLGRVTRELRGDNPENSESQETAIADETIRSWYEHALQFGQRWMNCEATGWNPAVDSRPGKPSESRGEIENRQAAMLARVTAIGQRSPHPAVQAAAEILAGTMRHLPAWLETDGDRSAPAGEPDPRHLLSADLLKIPALRLGADWDPENAPSEVCDEILKFLSNPERAAPDRVAVETSGSGMETEEVLHGSSESDGHPSRMASTLAALRHTLVDFADDGRTRAGGSVHALPQENGAGLPGSTPDTRLRMAYD